jgi:hypothetical protein
MLQKPRVAWNFDHAGVILPSMADVLRLSLCQKIAVID